MARDVLTETEKAIINRPIGLFLKFAVGVEDGTIKCLPVDNLPADFHVAGKYKEEDIHDGLTVAQWNLLEIRLRINLGEI